VAGDRVFGLLIAAIALGYILSATRIQIGFLSDPVGSRTFPYMIGGVALLCALTIIARPDPDPEWPGMNTIGRIAITLVVLFLFAISLRPIGFLIPAAIASGILSYQTHPKFRVAVLTGTGLSLGLYVVLSYGLGLGLAPFGRTLAKLLADMQVG